jgi:D-aspartate ligase
VPGTPLAVYQNTLVATQHPEVAVVTNFSDVPGSMTHSSSTLDSATNTLSAYPAKVVAGTPAVIVGADADGLGIARSLGKAGVPVIIVDTDARRPGMHSRYARPFVVKTLSGPGLIDGLLALRKSIDQSPLLFLTDDRQVRSVSEHRTQWAGAFHIRLPESDCIRQLLHKLTFQRLAERHGFPVPRAIGVHSEKDFVNFSEIQFPAVIKPGDKEVFFGSKAPRAQRVGSREEAETACRLILQEAPDLIVQEWIEGSESDIYFCLQYRGDNGLTISSFTGRKLRCWPPQTGSTASCTAAPEAEPELRHLTKAFFDKTQFVGMCSMEFKQDQRTGKFFMIEPTVGRTDWQEEVASINGVNIPLAAYCYELGRTQPLSEEIRRPLTWTYPPSYVRSLVRSALSTESFRDRRPSAGRVKSPCWSSDDPVPLFFFAKEWLRKFCSPRRWRELACERWNVEGAASAIVAQVNQEPASRVRPGLPTLSSSQGTIRDKAP